MNPVATDYAEYIAALGPLLLAVLGSIVTIKAFKGWTEFFWVVAFVVTGLISAAGTIGSINSTKKEQQELRAEITGGDYYSYFTANTADLNDRKNKIRLLINAGVRFHISPLGVEYPDPAYNSIGGATFSRIRKGTDDSRIALPPGQYRIDLLARNGLARQTFKIVEFQGKLIQVFDVVRDKKTVLSSPRPPGFSE